MYNPFTKHPRETVGETWWEHFKFSCGIGIRLFLTSIYFLVHALFPFIELHRKWNLECASEWLNKKNDNREAKKKHKIYDSGIYEYARKIKRKFPPNDFPLPKHEDINSGEK